MTIYALGQVLVMPVAGKLSDQFGRKTIFIAAVVIFTLASLACGAASSIELLVLLRAVQSIGGGAFMPSAAGIVSDLFGANRDRAVGMFTSIFPIGGIIGPALGGLFTTYWSWRGIVLINVPIGVALVLLALRFVPAAGPVSRGRLDVRGVALLGVGLLGFMLGISSLGSGVGVGDARFVVAEALALIAFAVFLRHSARHPEPFIAVRLLRDREFAIVNVINFAVGGAGLGFGSLVPIYAQDRYGFDSLSAGTLLTERAVGMVAVAGVAVMALRRTGYRLPMIAGFAVLAAGLLLMPLTPVRLSPYAWLATTAAITGIGIGFCLPATNNATMHKVTDQVAAVSGLRGMFRQAGAITAVSLATAAVSRRPTAVAVGHALGQVFGVFGVIIALMVPMSFLVKDRRGAW